MLSPKSVKGKKKVWISFCCNTEEREEKKKGIKGKGKDKSSLQDCSLTEKIVMSETIHSTAHCVSSEQNCKVSAFWQRCSKVFPQASSNWWNKKPNTFKESKKMM